MLLEVISSELCKFFIYVLFLIPSKGPQMSAAETFFLARILLSIFDPKNLPTETANKLRGIGLNLIYECFPKKLIFFYYHDDLSSNEQWDFLCIT